MKLLKRLFSDPSPPPKSEFEQATERWKNRNLEEELRGTCTCGAAPEWRLRAHGAVGCEAPLFILCTPCKDQQMDQARGWVWVEGPYVK